MVKGAVPKPARKPARPRSRITEDNIADIERDTVQKVSKSLSALEGAIASWDVSKEKPEDLRPKFMKYKRFHDALVVWERKMLKTPGKALDFYARLERLKEFANICYAYQ